MKYSKTGKTAKESMKAAAARNGCHHAVNGGDDLWNKTNV